MTWQEIIRFFSGCMPREIAEVLARQPEDGVREIRLRAGGQSGLVTASGSIACGSLLTQPQISQIAEALCEHALYARSEEQKQGFVTLRGGHRMGLCGRVITQGQTVRALREISSLCIRVASQRRGAADGLLPYLLEENDRVRPALIVGMPGTGKTTLLRDLCRSLSRKGVHVCVVDERSEIAAMSEGIAQLDVGPHTDVLDGCCKEAGMRWMLRAMSPDVLATDELGGSADVQAVQDAARSGVSVLTTLHGRDLETPLSHGALYQLARERVFERYVLLSPGRAGKIDCVCDEQLRPIPRKEAV